MAGTIRPNEMNVATTPTLAHKSLPGAPDSAKTENSSKKPSAPRAPRVDVEPLYTAVKSAISDTDWTTYKTALSSVLLGNLNQEELTQRLKGILSTPALEHAHNALVMGVYANVWRDAPEPGIASWVSSSDKPSSGVVKGTGDESEKRLKHEVMQLNRRERKRLKTIHQGGAAAIGEYDALNTVMQEYHDARRIKLPDTGPASAGGYQKTNWELEIRKRYTSSLYSETREFPTSATITTRMLPICYESGLPSGHAPDCAEYMNIATETYIKEALSNFFSRINANGPGYIRTADFKARVEKDERKVERRELQRGLAGELPVEMEERRRRKLLSMEDLRLTIQLGDQYMGQVPLVSSQIVNARSRDADGIDDDDDDDDDGGGMLAPKTNGIPIPGVPTVVPAPGAAIVHGNGNVSVGPHRHPSAARPNGFGGALHVDRGDPMVLDGDADDDLQFLGGSVQDMDGLDSVLDSVLDIPV
ncbi:transcriptional regulator of RNA polII, SAGA, subunit-domain-containing protein [Massariosphaeria phaeospora]|uniref:Transcriptional regulator of RNA polII, SAGA, subunit-domain-containing protein n=1 Tax=Massariosphaeria phaeospora TaxID=100035 RepID=A0A7C8MV63_9PLEO|nr:transcriptional regulator of RNA polII, SAGA, subunit-domain-containing protein [Massariosphaeria phaeospora]